MDEKRKFTDMQFIKFNVDVNTTAFKDKLLVGFIIFHFVHSPV